MIASFEHLTKAATAAGPRRVTLLFPHIESHVHGASLAQERGLAQCTLIGDAGKIAALAEKAGASLSGLAIIDEPDEEQAIRQALRSCQDGAVDVLVSGHLSLDNLLTTILDAGIGLRTGSLLSGVSVFELEGYDRLLLLSDGLMVVSPGLTERIGIVQNAVQVAHKLRIELPHVALLAATETVDPKNQLSMDAAHITVMARRKQIKGAIVDGPLGFDNAMSARAAQVKGIASDVSGQVDILVAPDIESGHLLLKILVHLCGGRAIHVIAGGTTPLVLLSDDDVAQTHATAIALGTLLS